MQWQSPDRKLLVLTAELKRGDLALRTAFPIMISNALNDFRDDGGELEHAWSTGEAVTLPIVTAEQELALRSPNGETRLFPVKSGSLSFGTLPHCGLWQILPTQSDNTIRQLACNLTDRNESNLRSAPGAFYRDNTHNIARAAAGHPIWFQLIVIAVVFTTTEWFLYQRRWVD
jgi:hypothetical protein